MDFLRGVFHRLIRLFLGPGRFDFWQRRGLHVTPVNAYQPIPDTRTLGPAIWSEPSELVGIEMNEKEQLALLDELQRRFQGEYSLFPERPTGSSHEFYLENSTFPAVDAKMLYCVVRHRRPRRIREVGAGFSTLVMAQAVRRNGHDDPAYACDFATIDPYPRDFVRAGVPGLSRLISKPVQQVPVSEFTDLQAGDILFIDSSHVLAIGSDVQYEYLEIIPRLRPGVLIHVHDIFFPAEYPREWVVDEHRFWNEQYLLQAFLAYNERFRILWASSFMELRHPASVEAAFASLNGGSLWMQRIQ